MLLVKCIMIYFLYIKRSTVFTFAGEHKIVPNFLKPIPIPKNPTNHPYAYTLPSSFPLTNVLKAGAPPLSNSGKYSIAEQVIVEIYLIMYTPDPTDKNDPASAIVLPDDNIKIDAMVGSDTLSFLVPFVSLDSVVKDIVIVNNDYKIYYIWFR